MDFSLLLLLAVLVVVVFFGIFIYNNLVTLKHSVSKSWSNIDVLLKQRHDELPKLVEVCKQYMQYEQETLEKITRARSAVMEAREGGDIKQLGQAESQLRMGLGHLFALAENYPDLKANDTVSQLTEELTSTENRVAFARQAYNDWSTSFNTYRQSFPTVLLASLFGFGENRRWLVMQDSEAIQQVPAVVLS